MPSANLSFYILYKYTVCHLKYVVYWLCGLTTYASLLVYPVLTKYITMEEMKIHKDKVGARSS